MHRHWPTPVKTLAATSLASAALATVLFCWMKRDWASADFANRWLVPLLPLVLFWAGAWARRSHGQVVWSLAAVLLSWSIVVSLVGATDPMPVEGYDGYTAAQALVRLVRPPKAPPDAIAGR
jgi:hypothetical protein